MNDNEIIARWEAEWPHKELKYIEGRETIYLVVMAYNTDITLWHGKDGLLAEIKRRGGILWCGYIAELLADLGQIVPQPGAAFADQARPCWAVLCATSTQLAIALARVIKSLAR